MTRAGTDAIEAIFSFETAEGRGNGVLRLTADGGTLKAWTLLTALDEIKGHEEQVGRTRRPTAKPIRAISAARTGSTSARRPPPTPTAIRPCWSSAAGRPGFRSPRA